MCEVLNVYGITKVIKSMRMPGGLVNYTFFVRDATGAQFIIQKLHKMFQPNLMDDIHAIVGFLKKYKWICPELVPTKDGKIFYTCGENLWRVYIFIEGMDYPSQYIQPALAQKIGTLLRRFHNSLARYDYSPKHVLEGFHNIAHYVTRARRIPRKSYPTAIRGILDEVIQELLPTQDTFSERIQLIHGDPRIENILFTRNFTPFTLIDYDTFMKASAYVDVGDCLRSLLLGSNPQSYRAVLKHFAHGYGFRGECDNDQYVKIKKATLGLTLELCLRFIIDTVEDCYFHWNPTKYRSRKEHNVQRALGAWHFSQVLRSIL